MRVKELIKILEKANPEAELWLGSDEELNTLFANIQVSYLDDKFHLVIYGLSGSEVELWE